MMGKNSSQKSIHDADYIIDKVVSEDSFYQILHLLGPHLFDDDFAETYCEDNGRKSIPPSTMALTTILQGKEDVFDREAEKRGRQNMAWKHALRLLLDHEGFDHTTLCKFRTRSNPLILDKSLVRL